jgi:hypothetical protein
MNEQIPRRGIAALIALRNGIASTGRLTDVLGDDTIEQAQTLMLSLRVLGLVQPADRETRPNPRTWALTMTGLEWLKQGRDPLQASARARKEILELESRKGLK